MVLTIIYTLQRSKLPAFLVRNGTQIKTILYNVNDSESVVYPGI